MKKTFLITAACAMTLSISSIAFSAEGPYVSGNLGLAIPSDSDLTDSTLPGITINIESDSGLALGVAAGYAFANNTRIEGEIAYQKNDLDKASLFGVNVDLTGDTSSLALLLNGYYDFKNASAFTPFISGGIGMAKVEINDMNIPGSGLPNTNEDDTVFAYQVGVGVSYAVNEKVSLDVKYRYFGTADPEFDTTEAEYSSHNVYAGIRVSF
jgi:opacity protein-like surface antigen